MRVRFKGLLLFTALTAPAGFAFAQTAAPVAKPPVASPQPVPMAAQPAIQQPAPMPQLAPPPPPPAVWTMVDANQLLLSIVTSSKEGLDPADYDSAGLMSAMKSNDMALLSAAATERFNKLSSDMALGHVPSSGSTELVHS